MKPRLCVLGFLVLIAWIAVSWTLVGGIVHTAVTYVDDTTLASESLQ